MNCNSWQNLSVKEKVDMVGELVHAIQNDEAAFIAAVAVISNCKWRWVFDGVVINPGTDEEIKDGFS